MSRDQHFTVFFLALWLYMSFCHSFCSLFMIFCELWVGGLVETPHLWLNAHNPFFSALPAHCNKKHLRPQLRALHICEHKYLEGSLVPWPLSKTIFISSPFEPLTSLAVSFDCICSTSINSFLWSRPQVQLREQLIDHIHRLAIITGDFCLISWDCSTQSPVLAMSIDVLYPPATYTVLSSAMQARYQKESFLVGPKLTPLYPAVNVCLGAGVMAQQFKVYVPLAESLGLMMAQNHP